MTDKPPAGWYPDNTGTMRWWDGEQWTAHTPPPPPTLETPTAEMPAASPPNPGTAVGAAPEGSGANADSERSWFARHKVLSIVGGLLIVFVALGLIGGMMETAPQDSSSEASEEPTAPTEEEVTSDPEPEAEPDELQRSSYKPLSNRRFALLVKDPDSHAGERYKVFGWVFQFDAATGTDGFLADVGPKRKNDQFGYTQRAALVADDSKLLKNIVEGDLVTMYATVIGAYNYETQEGGATTVPQFDVNIIKRTGSDK